MTTRYGRARGLLLSLTAGLVFSGCAAGMSRQLQEPDLTSPGTTGRVLENVNDVARRVQFAFAALDVAPFGSARTRGLSPYALQVQREPPFGFIIEGRRGKLDVLVKLEPRGRATTWVDIRARRSPTEHDSAFEKKLLEKIQGV